MPSSRPQHRVAILLVVLAASAWSTAAYFVRVLPYDSWTILFWRGVFGTTLIIACLLALQGRKLFVDIRNLGGRGVLVAALSTLGMTVFVPALQYTSAANVAVINATGPFVTAALAWIFLREASRSRTLIASFVALAGVATIVGGTQGNGADLRGIALAGLMTVAIAAMTVIVRRHRETPMAAASALSSLLGSVVSIPFAQSITSVTPHDLLTFTAFGFQIAIGLTCFIVGSRLLPSGQAALIATLETPLMPFWIFLAFGEVPAPHQLIGGALVLGAVIADIAGELRGAKRVAAPALPAG